MLCFQLVYVFLLLFIIPLTQFLLKKLGMSAHRKYRVTLEFKSSGCSASNKLIYDSSLGLSVSGKGIPMS